MTVFSIVLQSLLVLYYGFSGSAKVAGAKYWVDIFSHLGIPQWFRVVTGIVQLIGAAILVLGYWHTDAIVWGGAWLGITMLVAVLAHIRIKDSIGKTAPPVVFVVLIAVLTLVNAMG